MNFLAAVSAAANVVQGVGGLLAGQSNKRTLNAQAREELSAAQANERELRADARRKIGAQLAAQWANGFEGGSGTAADAVRESQLNAALDAREIRRQGVARAGSLRRQARQAETQGWFDLAGGLLGGASTYKRMSDDWAVAHKGTTPTGGGGG